MHFDPGRRVLVLASGAGTTLQALLAAAAEPWFGVEVVAVGTDRPRVAALDRAAAAGVPTFVLPIDAAPDRDTWDRMLTEQVDGYQPDLVVSAGFMRLVGPAFLERFGGRFLNSHPALLPAFPGMHAPRDALAHGVKVSGATLFVVDDGVDSGAILDQRAVPVHDDDDADSLHERIKVEERVMLVDVVGRMAREGWTVTGRKVTVP
ncbi:MAG TPA: phosphoribosylglycinamide formyltransferase [Actinomycetes bacterium]|nr:phosphoribosylglycinamide formyltransferase [Actinomycetes bacterium]